MKFLKREKGQGLVEYALIVVLIAVVVIGILSLLGPQLRTTFAQIYTALGGESIFTYKVTSSGHTITKSAPGPGKCIVKLNNLVVNVTDLGNPVSGLPVIANFSAGSISVDISATTNADGDATWSGSSTVDQSCSSLTGSVSIDIADGAASTSATFIP